MTDDELQAIHDSADEHFNGSVTTAGLRAVFDAGRAATVANEVETTSFADTDGHHFLNTVTGETRIEPYIDIAVSPVEGLSA